MTSLHDIRTADGRFDADMWLWSLCADAARTPLATMEFVNGEEVDKSLDSTVQREGVAWAQVKAAGTFRQNFNLRNYPFDRHRLVISLEEAMEDTRAFVYAPDSVNSSISPEVRPDGWRITGFRLVPREVVYPTNFGDPTLPPGSEARYSRLDLQIELARDQATSFFKLTIPLYAAAALALISFLMHTEQDARLNPRIAFLGGAMLTVVLNMRSIDEAIGVVEGVSMIDLLHGAVLVLIVAATAVAIACGELLERGVSEARVRRVDYASFWIGGLLYGIANAVIIGTAMRGG